MPDRLHAAAASIPAMAGIGLRFPHHRHVVDTRPTVAWFEVHAENYMSGRAPLSCLESIRRDYSISLHSVGLSLGSADPPDAEHLAKLSSLAARVQPGLVSDHLSWSRVAEFYLADLLPLPYTEEALAVVAENIERVQVALGRTILVENPSTYLTYAASVMDEFEFLAEISRRTGCGILCDINNLYVSASNHATDPLRYLDALPAPSVAEMHLAGHAVRQLDDGTEIRIDDHGSTVAPAVWDLYGTALSRFGTLPTLIEWDTDIPAFSVLESEAACAQRMLDQYYYVGSPDAHAA